jgi:hypothetical protein
MNYEGEFKLDHYDGYGVLTHKNEKIIFSGTFEEGIFISGKI